MFLYEEEEVKDKANQCPYENQPGIVASKLPQQFCVHLVWPTLLLQENDHISQKNPGQDTNQ